MKQFVSIFMSMMLLLCVIAMVPDVNAERVFADGYNGSTYEGSSTETIDYYTKTDNEISIKGAVPKYHNTGSNRNTCANVAGSIVVGYYDKDYDELIPNFKAARIIRDRVIFSAQTDAVQNVIDDLYNKMDTNDTGNGTTVEGFKRGLEAYVEQQGRSITYEGLVSGERLNIEEYKQAINNEKPVALFVSKYTMIPISDLEQDNNTDVLDKLHYGGDHVLVGYGIREIKYYNQDGSLKKEVTLLMAATGYLQDPLVYIIIDDRMTIVDGYTVSIY